MKSAKRKTARAPLASAAVTSTHEWCANSSRNPVYNVVMRHALACCPIATAEGVKDDICAETHVEQNTREPKRAAARTDLFLW